MCSIITEQTSGRKIIQKTVFDGRSKLCLLIYEQQAVFFLKILKFDFKVCYNFLL